MQNNLSFTEDNAFSENNEHIEVYIFNDSGLVELVPQKKQLKADTKKTKADTRVKKQVEKKKKEDDKETFSELKRMAKAWTHFVVKPEKKEIRAEIREQNKTLTAMSKMFAKAEKKIDKVVRIPKTKVERKPRIPKVKKQAPLKEEQIVISSPVFEKIEMSVEEETKEVLIMEASAENNEIIHDNDNDEEENFNEKDKVARDTYIQAVKEHTGVEVCGKKKKRHFIYPDEKKKQKEESKTQIEEEKKFKVLADDRTIIHDRTILRIPKKIRQRYNRVLKSSQTKTENKYQALKELVKETTNNTRNKISLKFRIGDGWLSTKVGSIDYVISDLARQLHSHESNYQTMGTLTNMVITRYEDRKALSKKHMVQGGRLIMDMNAQYLIISPQSNTNCFYHCLAYQVALSKREYNKVDEQEWIVEYSRALKRQFDNKKDYADLNDIQVVADYYGCDFTVYDNLFHIVSEIKGKCAKKNRKSSVLIGQHIKLQFKKNHCCLLVPRSQHVEFCEVHTNQRQTIEQQNEPILPKFNKSLSEAQAKKKGENKKRERVIMTYDIEAFKRTKECGTQVPFAIGICKKFDTENFEYQYVDFYGTNCAIEFFDHLSNYNPEKKVDVYLYAHNGAKYDLAVLNEVLLRRPDFQIDKEGFVELNGAVISMSIKNQHDIIFTFRDSARIFQGSLDSLCEDLKPHFMKLTNHKFDFDNLNAENICEPSLQAEIREYLRHDCLSLAQIMIEFREELILNPKIEIDITQCFTSATLAKKLYFQNYYWKYCNKEKSRYIYELGRSLDTDLRKSYFGGRCDIYGYGRFDGEVFYYDFTSLYPAMGAKHMYPIGNPVRVEASDIDLKNFYGFVQCIVSTNQDILPLHGHKYEGKLVFANHTNTSMMLFSEEIKYGLSLGYKYEVQYGYKFEKSPLLHGIMSDGFELKALAKKNNQPVLEKTWKIVINSAYGFFGLRWQDKRGVSLMTNEQLDVALSEKRVYNWNQISEDQFLVDQERDLVDIKGKSIAIASAVTSYARMELYAVMHAIQQKGYKVLYSDTDSIITNCNLSQHPDLMKRFMWDGCGEELGALKNECLDKCKKKLTEEELKQQIEADGGELKFDSVQILAPKVYSLRKQLINGKVLEIAKCKGVKKSSFEEQTKLLEGASITKDVLQFKSGKSLYLMDQDIEGRVQVVTAKKNLCQFDKEGKLKYSKGYVIGQEVLPFMFVNGSLKDESRGNIQEPSLNIDLE